MKYCILCGILQEAADYNNCYSEHKAKGTLDMFSDHLKPSDKHYFMDKDETQDIYGDYVINI